MRPSDTSFERPGRNANGLYCTMKLSFPIYMGRIEYGFKKMSGGGYECGRGVPPATMVVRRRFLFVFDSVVLEIVDGRLDRRDRLGVLVADLEAADVTRELLLEGHDQLDKVERVGVEVINEAGFEDDFILFDSKTFDDYSAYALKNSCHWYLLVLGEQCPRAKSGEPDHGIFHRLTAVGSLGSFARQCGFEPAYALWAVACMDLAFHCFVVEAS